MKPGGQVETGHLQVLQCREIFERRSGGIPKRMPKSSVDKLHPCEGINRQSSRRSTLAESWPTEQDVIKDAAGIGLFVYWSRK
jgi:hypothetical protein